MATVSFKGKVRQMCYVDGTKACDFIYIPQFKRAHCDMPAFRQHKKLGAYANSDMFLGMLERAASDLIQYGPSRMLKLDLIPDGVTVDTSGFLAVVTFDI